MIQSAERADQETTELHVPVAEERVEIEKHTREIGEVLLRRTVTEERQAATLDVATEALRVTRRNVAPRPALPAEAEQAFVAGTRRIPVLGERAVATKRPFVTGEVVVHRRPVTERRTITETVRHTVVEPEVTAKEAPAGAPAPAAPTAPAVASGERQRSVWHEVREGFSRGRQRT